MKKVIELSTLSEKQIRIMLAKDVIASLEAERLISRSGSWVRLETDRCDTDYFSSEIIADSDVELQELIKDKRCEVCALGALFIEGIRRFDNFTVEDLSDGYSIDNDDIGIYLEGIFDEDQLMLIEVAYERGHGGYNVRFDFHDDMLKQGERAVEFGLSIKDDRERLIAIMQNIIDNDGTFIPPEEKDD